MEAETKTKEEQLIALKAQAYDLIATREELGRQLGEVNNAIGQLYNEIQKEKDGTDTGKN